MRAASMNAIVNQTLRKIATIQQVAVYHSLFPRL